ncbi:MAG: biopolymer transporter ExbD [Roseiarcus sp.]|jgi:biopolymer transport protein ExbD/biopolymer transport protein TolR
MALPTRNEASGEDLYQPQAEINVTPLVDVMLVLLIVFMVTAPLLAAGVKVELPQAKAVQPLDPKDPIVVTVGKDGRLSLGTEEISADRLVEAVEGRLGEDRTRIVRLRGDKDAAYGDVVAVMDRLATHGVTHIAIVTGPKNRDAAPESRAEAEP